MKIVAPEKLIETIQDIFLPAPELEKFVQDHFLDEESKLYNEDHRHLRQARIAYLWTNVSNSRGGKTIAATAEIPRPPAIGGKWARAKWEFQMIEWFGHINFDFLITMNARIVHQSEPIINVATLDHELYHCGQKRDDFGAKVFAKKSGKPHYALLAHDVEEFVGIWRRYGHEAGAGDSIDLAAAAKRKPEIGKVDIRKLCGNCAD